MTGGRAITTEDEFRDRINALLETARRNDVSVEGAWSCRRTEGQSDYEVLVTEVVHRTE